MPLKAWLTDCGRLAKLWAIGCLVLSGLAAVFLAMALLANVPLDAQQRQVESVKDVPTVERRELPAEALARAVAGRRLIRASQVQAAVRDTGTAKRLLEQLKLQGVVQVGGQYAAYVQIANKSVQVVRGGDTILDFLVESVEPGLVKLSLEGVLVELRY